MAKWEVRLLNVRLFRGGSRHLFRGGVDLLTDSHTYTHLNWSGQEVGAVSDRKCRGGGSKYALVRQNKMLVGDFVANM